jgi:hypothetical protein
VSSAKLKKLKVLLYVSDIKEWGRAQAETTVRVTFYNNHIYYTFVLKKDTEGVIRAQPSALGRQSAVETVIGIRLKHDSKLPVIGGFCIPPSAIVKILYGSRSNKTLPVLESYILGNFITHDLELYGNPNKVLSIINKK